jgi:hypothetical protein
MNTGNNHNHLTPEDRFQYQAFCAMFKIFKEDYGSTLAFAHAIEATSDMKMEEVLLNFPKAIEMWKAVKRKQAMENKKFSGQYLTLNGQR